MLQSKAYAGIRNLIKTIDWKLLLFLLLFLHVKLLAKGIALVFIYFLRPGFSFGFSFKNSRLPLFYLLVIAIALVNWIIFFRFSDVNYLLVLTTGIIFWMACILAIHQLKLAVEINDPETIHRTIVVFFIINMLASYAVYAGIVAETGTVNAFRYQGNFQKYFMGTGDYIKGITFDTSTTNAVINAFGVLYFLNQKNAPMTIACMFTLLLTASNITNLLLCCIFLYLFIFSSTKDQKSIMVVCCMLVIIFMVKISPENNKYLGEAFSRFFNKQPSGQLAPVTANTIISQNAKSVVTEDERKQKIAKDYVDSMDKVIAGIQLEKLDAVAEPTILLSKAKQINIPPPPIHSASYQYKNDTSALQKKLLDFSIGQTVTLPLVNQLQPASKLPGKIIALQQTFRFFQQHPQKIITGTGAGNFSSKLAFRATALKIAGGYPARFAYLNHDFESNHFDLYLSYFTRQDKLHSLTNSPNSVYDQLLSEYGIAGILAFVFFYVGFFARHATRLSYGISLMLFTAGILFVDYWFEQLSVIILFELLLLLNIKETRNKKDIEHASS